MNLINTLIGLAVPIAIIYFLTTYKQRDPEGFNGAYRAALTIALLFVLWMMIPHVRAYTNLVTQSTEKSGKITAQLRKLSAADLQAKLIGAKLFAPEAGLRCRRAERDYDHVCSYMPTPKQSTTRLEFGVIVDEKRWLSTSARVPEGAILPPPPARR
jgi:hypothetical protein